MCVCDKGMVKTRWVKKLGGLENPKLGRQYNMPFCSHNLLPNMHGFIHGFSDTSYRLQLEGVELIQQNGETCHPTSLLTSLKSVGLFKLRLEWLNCINQNQVGLKPPKR